MAKLTRKTQKIFADSAAASQITAFGSIKANSPNPPVYSKDPDIIQSNEYMQGWSGATQDDYAPYRQDMNAIQNLVTRQLAYLYQAGIPEYDSATQYYANCSFCQINGVIYLCIQDALNKLPTTEPTYWTAFDLSSFAPKNSPAFTGTPTAPTPLTTDDSTKIATTAFIKAVLGGYAPLSSPALTGVPTAPTALTTDNSTQIATTAFVKSVVSGASTIAPGTILPWGGSTVPDGYLLCDGSEISRTTYADLYTAIGTNYGAGNGTTSFNIPNFNDRYPIGSGVNTVGMLLAEGLPNITGGMACWSDVANLGVQGAFSVRNNTGQSNNGIDTAPNRAHWEYYFNASASNSKYGRKTGNFTDTRVIPNSAVVNFIIKY